MNDCDCTNMDERTFVGTKLKYALTIDAPGFDMDDDEFEVLLVRGNKSIRLTKEELVVDADGQYYVCFDSRELGPGLVSAVITAQVPDEDFPGGDRTEVFKLDLVYIQNV